VKSVVGNLGYETGLVSGFGFQLSYLYVFGKKERTDVFFHIATHYHCSNNVAFLALNYFDLYFHTRRRSGV